MAKHRRSRDDASHSAGYRGQRLEELFREELNSLLDSEMGDPRLDGVRISAVELSSDGSRARAWFVLVEAGALAEEAQAALERAAGFLRSRLCEALPLKRIPELRFRHDPAAIQAAFEAETKR